MHEIGRRGPRNRPDVLRHNAKIAHVALLALRPEGHVLRIEGPAFTGVLEHGLCPQFFPVNAVGRDKSHQTTGRNSPQGLETLLGRHARSGVQPRRKVVGIGSHPGQHRVVLLRAEDLEKAKLRLDPVNAVGRFGVTGHLLRAAIGRFSAGVGTVIQPIAVAVFQHGDIFEGKHAFPRKLPLKHDPGVRRPMELERCPGERLDEVAIDEQLTARSDVDRRFRRGQCRGRRRYGQHD